MLASSPAIRPTTSRVIRSMATCSSLTPPFLFYQYRDGSGSEGERRSELPLHADLGTNPRRAVPRLAHDRQGAGSIVDLIDPDPQHPDRFLHLARNPNGLTIEAARIIEQLRDRLRPWTRRQEHQAYRGEGSHGESWPEPARASRFAKIATSTRRLACRPASVSLEPTGSVSPRPRVAIRVPLTPCDIRYVAAELARRS